MEKYKKYRDKLVHGKEFGNPINVEKATQSILEILEDQDWLKEIKFNMKSKTYNIHEIYERKIIQCFFKVVFGLGVICTMF